MGTLKSLLKSPRKAFDITMRVGNNKKYYKSNIAKAIEDMKKYPEILSETAKEATALKFLEELKEKSQKLMKKIGRRRSLSGAARSIRRFLSEQGEMPYVSLDQPLEHTGKMLGDALVIGQRGKETDYQFWIGFSAVHKSHVGSRFSGERYYKIAKSLDRGRQIKVTQEMRNFFLAAGMPLNEATTSFYIPPFHFMNKLSNEVRDIVNKRLIKELKDPSKRGKASRRVIG